MFLKKERPEIDDLERIEKNFISKGIKKKYYVKCPSLEAGRCRLFTPLQNIFMHILSFKKILSIFFSRKKNWYFLADRGWDRGWRPPPLSGRFRLLYQKTCSLENCFILGHVYEVGKVQREMNV